METSLEIKNTVREKYSAIAEQTKAQNISSCCGATSCCAETTDALMAEEYHSLSGYNPDADLGLGCGLPTEFAQIKEGDTVIDLGSGAGNDCFVARSQTGPGGKIIGVDFTPKMIERARSNAQKLQYNNIEFRQGDIESLPVTSNMADVIISNCVLNLVPNKHKAFSEIFRVLKPGGHFSISDIVLNGALPEKWKSVAELYAGCISGAIDREEYLAILEEAGFINIRVQKEKNISIPEEILQNYLEPGETDEFKKKEGRIKSLTVYGEKPAKDERKCCGPENSCC